MTTLLQEEPASDLSISPAPAERGFKPGKRRALRSIVAAAALTLFAAVGFALYYRHSHPGITTAWSSYGGNLDGDRFSTAAQITPANVHRLRHVWTFAIRLPAGAEPEKESFECTPVTGDNRLYVVSPYNRVSALDPATGRELWSYDPDIFIGSQPGPYVCRGVSFWEGRGGVPSRVFVGTHDATLVALDAATGKPCADFGVNGEINLKRGVLNVSRHRFEDLWMYHPTSPPAVVGNAVIVGSLVGDNQRLRAPSGVVRAFDARTGTLIWSFDPIPRSAADPASKTWGNGSYAYSGGANVWSVISADPKLGLVFLPCTSPSLDYYGGNRPGNNLYADCVVALRAETGRMVWAFQTVHHDVFDYDIPAEPVLIDYPTSGSGATTPAVAVATKTGNLFILDRLTGRPLVPVAELPVPQAGAVPGEHLSPTQPFPPPAFRLTRQRITPADAWGLTPRAASLARARLASLRCGPVFTPSSLQGTIVVPTVIGGMNWSGMSYDPGRRKLFMNVNSFAIVHKLAPKTMTRHAWSKRYPNAVSISVNTGAPYYIVTLPLDDKRQVPIVKPPWGELIAFDLRAGRVDWRSPLGTIPQLSHVPGASSWGSPSRGGCIALSPGLIFEAGTEDRGLRAFASDTGRLLWQTTLPGPGNATPCTYTYNGSQYVVICASGPREAVAAYALPN